MKFSYEFFTFSNFRVFFSTVQDKDKCNRQSLKKNERPYQSAITRGLANKPKLAQPRDLLLEVAKVESFERRKNK